MVEYFFNRIPPDQLQMVFDEIAREYNVARVTLDQFEADPVKQMKLPEDQTPADVLEDSLFKAHGQELPLAGIPQLIDPIDDSFDRVLDEVIPHGQPEHGLHLPASPLLVEHHLDSDKVLKVGQAIDRSKRRVRPEVPEYLRRAPDRMRSPWLAIFAIVIVFVLVALGLRLLMP